MKILLVSPHFPPKSIGGVEIYVKRLADELRSAGRQPEVLCVEEAGALENEVRVERDTEYGYPVHRMRANLIGGAESLGIRYHSDDVQHVVDRVIAAVAPDVVHLHSGYLLGGEVLEAARRRSIPTVVTLHDFWFICPRITLMHPSGDPCSGPEGPGKCAWCLGTEKRRTRVPDRWSSGLLGRTMIPLLESQLVARLTGQSGLIERLTARRKTLAAALAHVELILSPSRFLRDQVVSAGIAADRILISRYGIETELAKPRAPKSGRAVRIGYLGQLAPHKGVHVLIEAVRRMSSSELVVRVYGDPVPHPKYTQKLRTLAQGDVRISFEGRYQHSAVYDILAELDAIVVPSVWYENAPFVIQEAQAAGVPVLASRLGGMRELVADEQNGLLFAAGDATALGHQLQRLLDSPALLESLRPERASVREAADEMRELRDHYNRLSQRPPQV